MTWQIALSIFAGVVFAAVLAYNAWTLRKNAPPKPLGSKSGRNTGAGAVGGAMQEPALEQEQGVSEATESLADDVVESVDASTEATTTPEPKHNRWKIDERLDAVVEMPLPQTMATEKILAHAPDTNKRIGTKPYALEALNVHTQVWEYPQPGQRYVQLRMGVQMLNRSGPITDLEYSEFANTVQAWGEDLDILVDAPDMRDVVHTAREMDGVCSAYDVQLSMYVVPDVASWTVAFVQEQAEAIGFAKGRLPGQMQLLSSSAAEPILLLEFDSSAAVEDEEGQAVVEEVQLSFDVPCVAEQLRPYLALREASQILAERLQGKVVDNQGSQLDAEALESIGKELQKRYQELSGMGLKAGSLLCQRVFSS